MQKQLQSIPARPTGHEIAAAIGHRVFRAAFVKVDGSVRRSSYRIVKGRDDRMLVHDTTVADGNPLRTIVADKLLWIRIGDTCWLPGTVRSRLGTKAPAVTWEALRASVAQAA